LPEELTVVAAILVAVSLSGAGQQVPPPPPPAIQAPRDAVRRPADPVGTAVIRGRVVAADTGSPIRRAQLSLSPAPPPAGTTTGSGLPPGATLVTTASGSTVIVNNARPKSATSDSQGVFEFRNLPAGSYRLSASPGQYSAGYLSMTFGAKRPNGSGGFDPGTPIDVADGQAFDKATIALPRGAVITGRVTDDNGDPLARVQVFSLMYTPGTSRGQRNGNAQTDDLGQFRIFGLPPADYVVAAEARGNTFIAPNAPPETEEDKIGFITTYFPSSGDETSAQRVRAKIGTETPGVEIRMMSGRLFHVTGMVTDSQGRPLSRGNGMLVKRSAAAGTNTMGFPIDDQGHFQMRNIAPGAYRLTVRQQPPQGPRNPDGSPSEPGEFASMPLTINNDVDDILVTTSPGVTITGTVVFENGPPQSASGQTASPLRVSAQFGDPESMLGSPPPPPAIVAPDLTFTMKGLSGELLLRGGAQQNYLKAVMLGAQDITDTPREFKAGDRVTIVLTTQASTVEGNVTDAIGKPVTDANLIMFSDNQAAWRSSSIYLRRGGTDANGHFRLQGVLPGRYYLIALPRERVSGIVPGADPSVFEALAKEATTVVVGADEQRQVDVKVSAGGGGL
jgi:protocatechuate 3,4-dioxygenase beta subunit